MQNPTLIATPFAENGDKNIIPDSVPAEPQNATMQAGFPPITQQKISQGGIPPERNDFNGILNTISQHTVFLNKGGRYGFDATFAQKIGGYEKGACLTLSDGTQVVSDIDANTNDPNVNMAGWVRPKISASSILDESGKTQQEINNAHNNSQVYFDVYSKGGGFTTEVNTLISELSANGGGTIVFSNKTYLVDAKTSIQLKSNIHLKLSKATVFKALPYSTGSSAIIKNVDQDNCMITGGKLDGSRDNFLTPDGTYYKQYKTNTAYSLNDYVYINRWGFKVTQAGTTGATPPAYTQSNKVGDTFANGTTILTVVAKDSLGEWGMGISVSGAYYFTVKDISIINCWGDGIYIGNGATKPRGVFGKYHFYENIWCDNNRRQGITITSLKNSMFQNIQATNTSGTLPEAGIDFEPNGANNWLYDVIFENVYTGYNAGAGFLVSMQYMNDGLERIKAQIINHTDEYSYYGYQSLGVQIGGTTKGVLELKQCSYTNVRRNALIQNHNADGYQVYFNDCTFVSDTPTGQTDYFIQVSNAPADYSLGGCHVVRPRFRALQAANNVCMYVYANNTNGLPTKNISLINVMEKPTDAFCLVNSRDTEGVVLRDDYNLNYLDSARSSSVNITNWFESYRHYGSSVGTFNIQNTRKGRFLKFFNNGTDNLNITLTLASLTIDGYTNATVRTITLSPNGFLLLESISTDVMVVRDIRGVFRSGRRSTGQLAIPVQNYVAGTKTLIGTSTNLVCSRYQDIVVASSTATIAGNLVFEAYISANDTVQVYAINPSTTDYNFAQAGNYVNLAVL